MASDLYEEDIVLWAEQQAKRLRARIGGDNELDYENLAEEIDTVGRTEARGAKSLTLNILSHLMKIEFVGPAETIGHWRKEVKAFRRDLASYLSPTIDKRISAELEAIYGDAREMVLDDYEGRALDLPTACPYTWAEVKDPSYLPAPRYPAA